MTPRSLLALALGCSACVIARPAFVEPEWGDAPPPLVSEITEVTLSHRTCAPRCRDERITLRRDGRADRTYWTGKTADSLYLARKGFTAGSLTEASSVSTTRKGRSSPTPAM